MMKRSYWLKNVQITFFALASSLLFVDTSFATPTDSQVSATTNPAITTDHLKAAPNTVALTFDDGPDPRYTKQILAILDRYKIKATFFVIGENAKQYPELIKDIQAHGQYIANHSWSHPMLTRLSPEKLQAQIANTNSVIKSITGKNPVCIRPPFGSYNKEVINVAHQNGLQLITWDLNSFDYERKGTDTLVKWVTSKAGPGSVILMHDGGPRQQTVEALPKIIEYYKSRGIGFSPICYH